MRELRTGGTDITGSELFSASATASGTVMNRQAALVAPGEFSTAVKSALVLGKIFISKITHVSQLIFLRYLRKRKRRKEGEKTDWRK